MKISNLPKSTLKNLKDELKVNILIYLSFIKYYYLFLDFTKK